MIFDAVYRFVFLCDLHRMPYPRMHQTAAAPHTALMMPRAVKYHPSPAASIRGCRLVTPIAAMAHRVMLALAAAVLGFCGKISTNNVL